MLIIAAFRNKICQKQTSAASLDHLLSKGLID